METLMPGNGSSQTYTPQLKTVLKTYQLTAVKSLQGPSSALLGMDCKNNKLNEQTNFNFSGLTRNSQLYNDKYHDKNILIDQEIKKIDDDNNKKIIIKKIDDSDDDIDLSLCSKLKNNIYNKKKLEFTIPILTTSDQNCSERCETILENERISCFVVGGERRLCLPQILNTVLQDFSLQQINQVCDELQIYCSRCTHDQLEELKLSGILPKNAPSCGLITQTDAERLVSSLLLRTEVCELLMKNNDLFKNNKNNNNNCNKKIIDNDNDDNNIGKFKVYHECFGKCKGIFDADLFDSEDASCIECLECGCQFSPQKFVRHAHRPLENRTCHWGFDSTNWRSYLLLSRDQPHYTKVVTLFTNLKERYPVARYKRKATTELKQEEKVIKRPKKDDCSGVYASNGLGLYPASSPAGATDPYLQMQWAVFEIASRSSSAFRPWSAGGACKSRDSLPMVPAYLSRGPPVLQHPERVVPLSECERFEPHYQPNVALAPIIAPPINSSTIPLQRRLQQERHRVKNNRPTTTTTPPPPLLLSSLSSRLIPPSQQQPQQQSLPPPIPLSSLNITKLENHEQVSVKIERPSSPSPDLVNDYESCSPIDDQDKIKDRPEVIKMTPINNNNDNNNNNNNDNDIVNRDGDNDDDDDDEDEDDDFEEESLAAVTSSTVTMELPPTTIQVERSLSTSSSSNDSDIEKNTDAIVELEERLIALDVPQDVIDLARKVANELNNLKLHKYNDANEIARLRFEIDEQKKSINIDNHDINNITDDNKENSSVADSTEITPLNDNNHEPETSIIISKKTRILSKI